MKYFTKAISALCLLGAVSAVSATPTGDIEALYSVDNLPPCTDIASMETVLGCRVEAVRVDQQLAKAAIRLSADATLSDQDKLKKVLVYVQGNLSFFEASQDTLRNQFDPADKVSVIEVRFDAPQQDTIQDNAYALQQVFQTIENNRTSSLPMAVMGYSLGGVIASYSIRDLEWDPANPHHNIAVFVSDDAPHAGAVINQGIQRVPVLLSEYLDIAGLVNSVFGNNQQFDAFVDAWKREIALGSGMTFDSAIGEQLLIDNIHGSADYDAYLALAQSRGIPQNVDTSIAIARGSVANGQDGAGDTGEFFDFKGERTIASGPNSSLTGVFNMELLPTQAGQKVIRMELGTRSWFRVCLPFPFNWICWNNTSTNIITKQRNATNDAHDLDGIAAGYTPANAMMIAGATSFQNNSNFFNARFDITADANKALSYIPTASALGLPPITNINGTIDLNIVPFDKYYTGEDITGNSGVNGNNLNHFDRSNRYAQSFALVRDDILAGFIPTLPDAIVAILNGGQGNAQNISDNLCDALDLVLNPKNNNSFAQAEQRINVAIVQVGTLLNQGALTAEQHQTTVDYLNELLALLQDNPDDFAATAEGFPQEC